MSMERNDHVMNCLATTGLHQYLAHKYDFDVNISSNKMPKGIITEYKLNVHNFITFLDISTSCQLIS